MMVLFEQFYKNHPSLAVWVPKNLLKKMNPKSLDFYDCGLPQSQKGRFIPGIFVILGTI
jgi:hypothetical protein